MSLKKRKWIYSKVSKKYINNKEKGTVKPKNWNSTKKRRKKR